MTGKDPQRSCLGCRETKDKKDLLRFVLAPDRTLVPDLLARLPGRGAYTCMNSACLRAAASFIALVPVLAAFVLLQRFFVAGLTAGAVKG
jgi:predicted RNA-binding protein YlxR (DUF448 family)